MIIKTAGLSDFDSVIAFYHDLIDSMQDAEYRPKWEKDVYPSRQFIYDSIARNELIATVMDGEIAGAMVVNHDCAEAYDKAAWKTDANRDQAAVIHILAVAARHQGRGLAKKMVAYAVDDSRKKGMKAIRLDVLAQNKPAHHLYISAGFAYIGTVQIFYEDTGLTDFMLYEFVL
ncbi:MAG: GNAT family N-acetyltransferase [Oscillospiraceae bacterium]|nr:GNAT family N-acetyltransferase [Oscillospiraceae bacterium]